MAMTPNNIDTTTTLIETDNTTITITTAPGQGENDTTTMPTVSSTDENSSTTVSSTSKDLDLWSTNSTAIVGIGVATGAIVIVIVILFFLILFIRRTHKKKHPPPPLPRLDVYGLTREDSSRATPALFNQRDSVLSNVYQESPMDPVPRSEDRTSQLSDNDDTEYVNVRTSRYNSCGTYIVTMASRPDSVPTTQAPGFDASHVTSLRLDGKRPSAPGGESRPCPIPEVDGRRPSAPACYTVTTALACSSAPGYDDRRSPTPGSVDRKRSLTPGFDAASPILSPGNLSLRSLNEGMEGSFESTYIPMDMGNPKQLMVPSSMEEIYNDPDREDSEALYTAPDQLLPPPPCLFSGHQRYVNVPESPLQQQQHQQEKKETSGGHYMNLSPAGPVYSNLPRDAPSTKNNKVIRSDSLKKMATPMQVAKTLQGRLSPQKSKPAPFLKSAKLHSQSQTAAKPGAKTIKASSMSSITSSSPSKPGTRVAHKPVRTASHDQTSPAQHPPPVEESDTSDSDGDNYENLKGNKKYYVNAPEKKAERKTDSKLRNGSSPSCSAVSFKKIKSVHPENSQTNEHKLKTTNPGITHSKEQKSRTGSAGNKQSKDLKIKTVVNDNNNELMQILARRRKNDGENL